jgi:hypothetical protein
MVTPCSAGFWRLVPVTKAEKAAQNPFSSGGRDFVAKPQGYEPPTRQTPAFQQWAFTSGGAS